LHDLNSPKNIVACTSPKAAEQIRRSGEAAPCAYAGIVGRKLQTLGQNVSRLFITVYLARTAAWDGTLGIGSGHYRVWL
jgi:hypothetical protein